MKMKNKNWEPISVDKTKVENPHEWFEEQYAKHGLPYLLIHADDGVIWGRFNDDGNLAISSDEFNAVNVELRAITLQQARLFGPEGELLLWRTENGFSARIIADGEEEPENAEEEHHVLWGEGESSRNGFTLMRDGQQGMLYAPPLDDAEGAHIRLKVRHYIDYDDQGQAYVSHSRLVDLEKF